MLLGLRSLNTKPKFRAVDTRAASSGDCAWYSNFPENKQVFILLNFLILNIIIIYFMKGIYTYIPETNRVPKEYSVSAILSSLFMVSISLVPALALLYFYVTIFQSMCAVPNMAVFCSSFTSWFPGMLLMYFLNDFEMVPVAPIITGITLVFTFHMRCFLLSGPYILKSSRLPF